MGGGFDPDLDDEDIARYQAEAEQEAAAMVSARVEELNAVAGVDGGGGGIGISVDDEDEGMDLS